MSCPKWGKPGKNLGGFLDHVDRAHNRQIYRCADRAWHSRSLLVFLSHPLGKW